MILLTWPTPSIQAQDPQDPADVQSALAAEESVRVIVALRSPQAGVDVGVQIAEVERAQETVLDELDGDDFELIQSYEILPGMVGEVTAEGLEALLEQPEVAAVALDLPVHSALSESSLLIGADVVHNLLGFTGAGVNVALLDTGVDATHPDLADNLIVEKCFNRNSCPPDNTNESDNAADSNGHGSHIAGIITGRGEQSPRGIAPDAGIVAVRVLGSNGSGLTSDVLAGLDWVVANQVQFNIKVINLSLGGGSYSGVCDEADAVTRLYAEAVGLARAAGITIFAASGNSGLPEQMMTPACISGVISVGSTYDANVGAFILGNICTDENTGVDQITCSSNSSSELDLLAPGAPIVAAALGGGQTSKAGTSMSTGLASAVAALMLEAAPNLSPDEIETILEETGLPILDERNGRITPRLNALAAVAQVSGNQLINISGAILLQGRSDHSGTQIFVSQEPCAEAAGGEPAALTGADGRFTITALTGRTYGCLQAVQPGYLRGEQASPGGELGAITLPGGDVTGDGMIDIFDLSLIGARFDSADAQADVNADGLVDIFDLVLAAANYDQAGPVSQWNEQVALK